MVTTLKQYFIQIVNESTVVSDKEIASYVPALQIQISRDFAPIWGADATLEFVPKGGKLDSEKCWLGVFDHSDQAGALGYHDVTPNGMPIGKVFAADGAKYGNSLSVTISHELVELLGDPSCEDCMFDEASNRFFCKEAADAVEDDSLGYKIGGVLVSDFVTPDWFCANATAPGTKYDFLGHCKHPLQILTGGYIGYLDLHNAALGFQEITADKRSQEILDKKQAGSRRDRRLRIRSGCSLIVSTVADPH